MLAEKNNSKLGCGVALGFLGRMVVGLKHLAHVAMPKAVSDQAGVIPRVQHDSCMGVP